MNRLYYITIFVLSLVLVVFQGYADEPEGGFSDFADQFHTALSSADEDGVRSLLHPEVLIFESGGQESSLEEYASHHMLSDMKFMANVKREIVYRKVIDRQDTAMVLTKSHLRGFYNGKVVDAQSTESLLFEKSAEDWLITHIHWSSR